MCQYVLSLAACFHSQPSHVSSAPSRDVAHSAPASTDPHVRRPARGPLHDSSTEHLGVWAVDMMVIDRSTCSRGVKSEKFPLEATL